MPKKTWLLGRLENKIYHVVPRLHPRGEFVFQYLLVSVLWILILSVILLHFIYSSNTKPFALLGFTIVTLLRNHHHVVSLVHPRPVLIASYSLFSHIRTGIARL